MSDARCSKVVHGKRHGWRGSPCSRRGVIEEDGKWWCKQHSPSAQRARNEKSLREFEESIARSRRESARRKSEREALSGIDDPVAWRKAMTEAIDRTTTALHGCLRAARDFTGQPIEDDVVVAINSNRKIAGLTPLPTTDDPKLKDA